MQSTDNEILRVSERILFVRALGLPNDLPMSVVAHVSICQLPQYESFCDDFGPLNMATVYRFCEVINSNLDGNPVGDVAFSSPLDLKSTTNAIFLLGAYLIMIGDEAPSDVQDKFQDFKSRLVSYRDVSAGRQNFHLFVRDCWDALWKGKQLNWINFGPDEFNLQDYETCDSPLNADLHEVVPGKFVAMRGPRDLPDGRSFDDSEGTRNFSPGHYAEILRQFDVQVVVRLNEVHYHPSAFEREGLAVADLFFDDCTAPPPTLVAAFLAIAEGIPGALAVHCSAGLGRTGTLIAAYIIKHHDFTAREAIAWLRVLRPGSVIGNQQAFLCAAEPALRAAGRAFRRRAVPVVGVPAGAPVPVIRDFIDAACAAATVRASNLGSDGTACAAARTLPRAASGAHAAVADASGSDDSDSAPVEGEAAAGGGSAEMALGRHVARAGQLRAMRRQWFSWTEGDL